MYKGKYSSRSFFETVKQFDDANEENIRENVEVYFTKMLLPTKKLIDELVTYIQSYLMTVIHLNNQSYGGLEICTGFSVD